MKSTDQKKPDKTVFSSEASSIFPKATDKNRAGAVGEKQASVFLLQREHESDVTLISPKATDKNRAGAVGEKQASVFLPPHGHKDDVPLEKNRTASKESVEIKATAGNVKNAGDSPAVSKK